MNIPENVSEYIRHIFKACNQEVSNKISRQPATWETSLDQTFIDYLSKYSSPVKLDQNCLVYIDTHYIGGLRHWHSWEVADIGILVIFRRNGRIERSKVALLQSKRLYPLEIADIDDGEDESLRIGFGRLMHDNDNFAKLIAPRTLTFDESAIYRALKLGDEQCKAISGFQNHTTIPVYYLFYNPCQIPHSVQLPLIANVNFDFNNIGARVVPASILYAEYSVEPDGYSPSFGDLKHSLPEPFNVPHNLAGWRIEDFIVDQLLACREGYIVKEQDDFNLSELFYRRSGPIAAALSITIDVGGEG